ncbi:uncharacterized protein [Dysidea avara]|uniref:uncharacterized protein n=1 Tax=Dysidea avara TaxID=196820 RepID=UPI00332D6DEF
MNRSCIIILLAFAAPCLLAEGTKLESASSGEVLSVTFLLTVNDTWYPGENNGKKCLHTVKTPPLKPNTSWTDSIKIQVGECDHGPLTYTISKELDDSKEHTYIDVIFYSSVIVDASHPNCRILWDYKYTEPVPLSNCNCKPSLLPGCFNAESREGYHMTYYWFNVLDWEIG